MLRDLQTSHFARDLATMQSACCAQRHTAPFCVFKSGSRVRTLRSISARRTCVRVQAATATRTDQPHLQLATAKIPRDVDPKKFAESMYQWAATLTQSGKNLPFALPLQTDKLPDGFQILLLKRSKSGGFGSAGDLVATVEDEPQVGKILFVRFYEGPTAQDARLSPPPKDPTERLEVLLASLIDVDTIMSKMPVAIRNAVAYSR